MAHQQQQVVARKRDNLWKRAQEAFERLPPELHKEIYRHSLTARRTVTVNNKADAFFPYSPYERSKELDDDLKQSLSFYSKVTPVARRHEAHAFFLSHNTFVVRSKAAANTLVRASNSLRRAGQAARILNLHVRVEPPEEFMSAGSKLDSDGPKKPFGDDNDYDPSDHHLGGARDLRVLQPLVNLQSLQKLTIIADVASGNTSTAIPGNLHFSDSIDHLAAVIAKLRALVYRSSGAPEFTVLDHAYDAGAPRNDCTWLWEPPSPEETAEMEQYWAARREADAPRFKRFQTVRRGGPTGNIKAEYNAILARIKPFLTNWSLMKRCRVLELAADPNWERKANSEATEESLEWEDNFEGLDNYWALLVNTWWKEKGGFKQGVELHTVMSEDENEDSDEGSDFQTLDCCLDACRNQVSLGSPGSPPLASQVPKRH